jgi:hypothetical protein
MIFQRVNFGFGLLANPLTAIDTVMTMAVGHYLPIDAGPMRLVLWNAILYPVPIMDPNFEVITAYYSGILNQYDIVRAQEDTFAHPHAIGDKVAMTYTKGVSSSDLFVLGSKELDESNIADKRVVIYNALTNRLEYGLGGGGGGGGVVTKTLWVDKNRTDSYIQDGSVGLPYKTIQAAINRIATNGDNAANSYLIEIAPGIYHETLVMEDNRLRNVSFHGNGEVVLQPLGGSGGSGGSSYGGSSYGGGGPLYAFRSLINNSYLLKLHIDNIVFEAPFVVVGANGGNTFSDVELKDCEFISEGPNSFGISGGMIDVTCVNNFRMKGCKSTESITFNNVWWNYFESCHLEGDFSFTSSEVRIPSSGKDNMSLFNGTYLQGGISFLTEVSSSGGGNATYTLVANASRIGRGSPVYVNPEVVVYAQNSFLRGRWTNNGLIILSNSFAQSFNPSGIGLLNIDDQPAGQLKNDSTVPGVTIKDALDYLLGHGGANDHSLLANLDFDNAGHIGFQSELIWDVDYRAYLIKH